MKLRLALKALPLDPPTHGKVTLRLDGGLTYIPDPGFVGIDSFTYGASDGILSSGIGKAIIVVTPGNSTPSAFDVGVNAFEDSSYTFQVSDFVASYSSGAPPAGLVGIQIASAPYAGSGNLTSGGLPALVGQTISVADLVGGKLSYIPPADKSDASYATSGFTYRVVSDGGISGGAPVVSSTTNTMTVNVSPVNDMPTGIDSMVTTSKSAPHIFEAADFQFSDTRDNPPNKSAAVKIAALPTVGQLTLDGLPAAAGQIVSKKWIAAGRLRYAPDPNQLGFPITSFTFQVQDDGGTAAGGINLDSTPNVMTVNVAAGDYLPSGIDQTVPLMENQAYSFKHSDFAFTLPAGIPPQPLTAVRIVTLPKNGLSRSFKTPNGTYSYSVAAGDIAH